MRDDGTIKVSRSLKERAALIRTARQRLTGTLGREPTLAELSEATALQPEDIAVAETATCATESLQRRSGEDGFALEDVLTEGEMEEKILERIALREAIAQLTDREQMVIRLRYFHGLTQDKTAKILGVSQVQISRIEKKGSCGTASTHLTFKNLNPGGISFFDLLCYNQACILSSKEEVPPMLHLLPKILPPSAPCSAR